MLNQEKSVGKLGSRVEEKN